MATAIGLFANACHSEWIARIRTLSGDANVDASALQTRAGGNLTRQVSLDVYTGHYAGISYLSRLGHDVENLAIFDRSAISGSIGSVAPGDPDLCAALRLLGIDMPS